jgi:hypothetical protein
MVVGQPSAWASCGLIAPVPSTGNGLLDLQHFHDFSFEPRSFGQFGFGNILPLGQVCAVRLHW